MTDDEAQKLQAGDRVRVSLSGREDPEDLWVTKVLGIRRFGRGPLMVITQDEDLKELRCTPSAHCRMVPSDHLVVLARSRIKKDEEMCDVEAG